MLSDNLNCTEDALKMGNRVNQRSKALELLKERNILGHESIIKTDNQDLEEALKLATKAQFCREAIEVSLHKNILN